MVTTEKGERVNNRSGEVTSRLYLSTFAFSDIFVFPSEILFSLMAMGG